MVEPKQSKTTTGLIATRFDAIGTAGELRDKGIEPDQAEAIAKGMSDASSVAVTDAVNIFQTEIKLLRTDLEKQIGGLDSKIDVLRADLEKQTGELDSKIDVLRADLEKQIGGLGNKINVLRVDSEKQAGGLDNKIDVLRVDSEKQAGGLDSKIDVLRADLGKDIADMQFRLTATLIAAMGTFSAITIAVIRYL